MHRIAFTPPQRMLLGVAAAGLLIIVAWRLGTVPTISADDAPSAGDAHATAAASASAVAECIEPWTEQEFQLRERLLQIAGEYLRYGRVDDEARWAPYLCRMPNPSMARFSAADSPDGHAQKLYFLFARDRAGYVNLDRPKDKAVPAFQVGAKGEPQVVVKEAWAPELYQGETPPDLRRSLAQDAVSASGSVYGGGYYPYVQKDGKTYHAAKKSGLFVMFQADGKLTAHEAPDTDDGWLYGTLTADGKTVTAAGKIKSCMECHQQAPHGRLFGLAGKAAEGHASGR
jgi:hypothetical protein